MSTDLFDTDTPEGLENAARWMRGFLGMVSDNGVWGIPRAETIYHFNKPNKTVQRHGPGDEPTEKVLKHIGYTVIGPN